MIMSSRSSLPARFRINQPYFCVLDSMGVTDGIDDLPKLVDNQKRLRLTITVASSFSVHLHPCSAAQSSHFPVSLFTPAQFFPLGPESKCRYTRDRAAASIACSILTFPRFVGLRGTNSTGREFPTDSSWPGNELVRTTLSPLSTSTPGDKNIMNLL